jgi:hypothetical protein
LPVAESVSGCYIRETSERAVARVEVQVEKNS